MNTRTRNRYLADSVTTASPGTLLVRLYDRLLLDLQRGERAIRDADPLTASETLTHAQDIVAELHATLRVDAWSGGPALAQIYEFALRELIRANIDRDADRVASIHALFEPLRDSWRQAATSTEATATSTSLTA